MKKLVALGRIETASEVFNPGTCLPEAWTEAEKQRLVDCGAAEMREVTEEDVAASGPAEKTETSSSADDSKFDALLEKGVATKELITTICAAWEVKSWEDFASLSEAELISVKGVGKATALKIIAAVKEI